MNHPGHGVEPGDPEDAETASQSGSAAEWGMAGLAERALPVAGAASPQLAKNASHK